MKWMVVVVGLAAACGTPDLGDALVVVQETNVPDEWRGPPCADHAHDYTVDYVRECDDSAMQVHVCSDVELCEAQIDELVAPLVSCDEEHSYEAEIPDGC